MKVSFYNNILNIQGTHSIIFNSLTKNILLLKDFIITPADNLLKIAETNPSMFDRLRTGGFIINEDYNEVDKLKTRIQEAIANPNEFVMHINPTLDCNLKCWYCYENHIHGSQINSQTCDAIKNLIKNITRDRQIKVLDIGFFGGEPLYNFFRKTSEIIQFANDECESHGILLKIHFTTNVTLIDDKIISFLKSYHCGFQITLDGGKEDHDKTRFFKNGNGTFELIVNNILKLVTNKFRVIVRINYTSSNIYSIKSIKNRFLSLDKKYRRYIDFDFQRVWQERSNSFDHTEQLISSIREEYRKEGYNVLGNYLLTDVSNPCYGDKKNHVMINYNGEIFGCTARDFSSKNRLGIVSPEGELIYDNNKGKEWAASKFSKQICHTCRIAPICGGGCRQRSFEDRKNNLCTFRFTETDKDNRIIDLIDHLISNQKLRIL